MIRDGVDLVCSNDEVGLGSMEMDTKATFSRSL
jgi:hypothetical protein